MSSRTLDVGSVSSSRCSVNLATPRLRSDRVRRVVVSAAELESPSASDASRVSGVLLLFDTRRPGVSTMPSKGSFFLSARHWELASSHRQECDWMRATLCLGLGEPDGLNMCAPRRSIVGSVYTCVVDHRISHSS